MVDTFSWVLRFFFVTSFSKCFLFYLADFSWSFLFTNLLFQGPNVQLATAVEGPIDWIEHLSADGRRYMEFFS